MSNQQIIRAWKDAEYRANLSEAARASLPAHPAGWMEVANSDLNPPMAGAKGLRVQSTIRAGRAKSLIVPLTFPCW